MSEYVVVNIGDNERYVADYSLYKTLTCNQFFRWKFANDDAFYVATRDMSCIARQYESELHLQFEDASNEDVDALAHHWLHFLGATRGTDSPDNEFVTLMQSHAKLREVYDASKGLCLIRQDPWECLLGYIISQNNNVGRIHNTMDAICERYGKRIAFDMYSTPTAKELNGVELRDVGLGYRDRYIASAVQEILNGFDLNRLSTEHTTKQNALNQLTSLQGVGIKVASCVALFSLGFTDSWPIDTWIKRFMERENITSDDVRRFGRHAGLIQEHIYYYMTNFS